MKFNAKKIVPIFIAVIFLSSVLVVFATGGIEASDARLVLDFGQPEMFYNMEVSVGSNTSALRMLSAQVPEIMVENGQINCIMEYCNTGLGVWKFYSITEGPLGLEENEQENPEDYIIREGEAILFRYELKQEIEETILSEDINETSFSESLDKTNTEEVNQTNITS